MCAQNQDSENVNATNFQEEVVKCTTLRDRYTIDFEWTFPFVIEGYRQRSEQSIHPNREAHFQVGINALVGSFIIRLFAIWESIDPSYYYVSTYFNSREQRLFRGYKHLRHTFSHGFNGARANGNKRHFDDLMASEDSLAGLQFDDNRIIIIDHELVYDCWNFLRGMAVCLPIKIAKHMNGNPTNFNGNLFSCD